MVMNYKKTVAAADSRMMAEFHRLQPKKPEAPMLRTLMRAGNRQLPGSKVLNSDLDLDS